MQRLHVDEIETAERDPVEQERPRAGAEGLWVHQTYDGSGRIESIHTDPPEADGFDFRREREAHSGERRPSIAPPERSVVHSDDPEVRLAEGPRQVDSGQLG
jgi:hypothetical protein